MCELFEEVLFLLSFKFSTLSTSSFLFHSTLRSSQILSSLYHESKSIPSHLLTFPELEKQNLLSFPHSEKYSHFIQIHTHTPLTTPADSHGIMPFISWGEKSRLYHIYSAVWSFDLIRLMISMFYFCLSALQTQLANLYHRATRKSNQSKSKTQVKSKSKPK